MDFTEISRWADARKLGRFIFPEDGSIGGLIKGRHPRATVLLWALALEVDEREATRTGEQVCRRCGGSGTTWAWGHSDLAGNVDPDGSLRVESPD